MKVARLHRLRVNCEPHHNEDRLQTAVTAEGTTTYGYFPDGLPKSTAFFDQDVRGALLRRGGPADGLGDVASPGDGRLHGDERPQPAALHVRLREGNRLTQVEDLTVAGGATPGSAETTEYGYDEESRLVGVKYPDNTAALYQLDAVGNRVGERKAMGSLVPALTAAAFPVVSPAALTNDVVAVFNRADWLESVTDSCAPAKDATFEWDAAGNLTRQQTAGRDRRFTWDVKQTLTKVEDNGIEAGRYDYGADGLRSKRVTSLESVEYVLDGMQVLVETDGADSAHPAKRRYHYASAALAVTDISGATRTTKALHLDALGSPATETTQAGAVAAVRQYDAWGLYRNGTAPGGTDAKLGYTGHQYDPETGLVYARARYYDAEYGRFLSRDSVEGALNSAPSLHRYGYGNFNPLRYADPTGRCVPVMQTDGVQLDCRDREIEETVDAVDARTEREWAAGNYGDAAVGVGLGLLGRFALIPSRVNEFVWGNPFNAGSDAVSPYNTVARTGNWADFDSKKSISGWTQIAATGAAKFIPAPNAPTAAGRIVQSASTGGATTGVAEGTRQLATAVSTWDAAHLDPLRVLEATAVGGAIGGVAQQCVEAPSAPGSVMLRADQVELEPPLRPRVDLTDRFRIKRTTNSVELKYGNEEFHGLAVSVRDETAGFDIRAGGNPKTMGSGTDMMLSALNRLRNEGVTVNKLRGYWIHGSDSVNAAEFLTNVKEMTPEQAATNTWTGRLFLKLGYSVETVDSTASATKVIFGKPK